MRELSPIEISQVNGGFIGLPLLGAISGLGFGLGIVALARIVALGDLGLGGEILTVVGTTVTTSIFFAI